MTGDHLFAQLIAETADEGVPAQLLTAQNNHIGPLTQAPAAQVFHP